MCFYDLSDVPNKGPLGISIKFQIKVFVKSSRQEWKWIVFPFACKLKNN